MHVSQKTLLYHNSTVHVHSLPISLFWMMNSVWWRQVTSYKAGWLSAVVLVAPAFVATYFFHARVVRPGANANRAC